LYCFEFAALWSFPLLLPFVQIFNCGVNYVGRETFFSGARVSHPQHMARPHGMGF
jgi:hypothetical protein